MNPIFSRLRSWLPGKRQLSAAIGIALLLAVAICLGVQSWARQTFHDYRHWEALGKERGAVVVERIEKYREQHLVYPSRLSDVDLNGCKQPWYGGWRYLLKGNDEFMLGFQGWAVAGGGPEVIYRSEEDSWVAEWEHGD